MIMPLGSSSESLSGTRVEIRELHGVPELEAAERIQEAVWGREDVFDSKDLLLAIQMEGGLVAGALASQEPGAPASSPTSTPSGDLVGFLFAFPTRDARVQHSHRLAVLPGWRKQGMGARLKWFQRDWSLARGIETIHWTFDPLRAVNADLNIRRLGATAKVYLENFYGTMRGINAGISSDRLLVEWRLNSARVVARANGMTGTRAFKNAAEQGGTLINQVDGDEPVEEYFNQDAPRLALQIPTEFSSLLDRNRPLAQRWRVHMRRLLSHYFERGYRITEFTWEPGPIYLLEKTGKKGSE
jgi:chorismate synthase